MISRMWICRFAIVITMNIATGHLFAQTAGALSGTVFDLMGAVIPNSVVILYWNPPGNEMSWNGVPKLTNKSPRRKGVSVTTDEKGQFSVKLSPGSWDLFVHADGLYPMCRVVQVEVDRTQNIELHFSRHESPAIQ